MRRSLGKLERSPSPAMECTSRHGPLLRVPIPLAMHNIETIVDCAASTPVVGNRSPKEIGVRNTAQKANDIQVDSSYLSIGNLVLHTSLKVFDFVTPPTSPTVLCKF